MAYNNGYNPDALPAHAEPEQAAQLLSNNQQPARPVGNRPSSGQAYYQNQQPSYGKPQPPAPFQKPLQQHGSYAGPSNPQQPNYGQVNVGRPYPGHQQQIPPAGYGIAPNAQNYQNRPIQASRPTPTPAPGSATDPSLYPMFRTVDKDGSGQLSERELRAALVNGDYTAFDPQTVRMMIRMFDSDRSGTINFEEFCGLWGFLGAWRTLFDRFDTDRSGNISLDEYTNALVSFGYRLSPQFTKLLFNAFDKRRENAISFDLFVQSCISLKRMTDVFKKYDDDRDGYITLSFEEFLTEILRQR